jgi:maltose alpha-D-glucosyltransferase/alpha-amylase
MTQAGLPTIYYGDEIGMRYVPGTPAKEGSTLNGVTAPNAGAPNGERAGTRTPMSWDGSKNDGFSTAESGQLYLPQDVDSDRPTVAAQEADPHSLLHFVRQLLTLRMAHGALGTHGSFELLNPEGAVYPLVYRRRLDNTCCLVAVNPTSTGRTIRLDSWTGALQALLMSGIKLRVEDSMIELDLEPFAYGIYDVDD